MEKAKVQLAIGDRVAGEVIKLFAATRNEDLQEGRGARIDHSYHLTEHEALIASSKIDVMGTDGKVEKRIALRLSDGQYLLLPKPITVSENPEAEAGLRKQALAKLTPAEIAALLGK